jgi:hypothetical protein
METLVSRRPVLITTAAVAALALCAASGTASAATTSTKGAGRGTSNLSLLSLSVAGHQLSLADIALTSDTLVSPRVSSIAVTPVTVDGTGYGRQTVNQSSSPKTIGALSAPSALAPFASMTSPAINLNATSAPSNSAGASSLGNVKVLGLPVSLAGALQAATSVSSTAGAQGLKTVTIDNLALPSIADILGALGLDLSKLPVGSLDDLVNALDLVTGAIVTAENAVDTAQAAVNNATSGLATQTAALTSAQGTLTTATAQLTTATTTVNALLGTAGIADVAAFQALLAPAQAAAELLAPGLGAAVTSYLNAQTALAAAQTAVTTALGLVNTAQALLTTVTNTLMGAVDTLFGLISTKLDSTPLVSLDSLEVTTRALVTSASAGGQKAEVVGGVVKGLHVLGVDVLDAALGSSTLDLAGSASALAQVNSLMDEVTGTLSDVLSSVPGLPALNIPAPNITLLTKSATTSISGGFGRADTVVQGLRIQLPAITMPTSVALPGAANLPALSTVTQTAGNLMSSPISLGVLTLHDQAAFSPTVVGSAPGTPGTPGAGGHLADTGLPVGVAVLALLLVSGALVVRRRVTVTA